MFTFNDRRLSCNGRRCQAVKLWMPCHYRRKKACVCRILFNVVQALPVFRWAVGRWIIRIDDELHHHCLGTIASVCRRYRRLRVGAVISPVLKPGDYLLADYLILKFQTVTLSLTTESHLFREDLGSGW